MFAAILACAEADAWPYAVLATLGAPCELVPPTSLFLLFTPAWPSAVPAVALVVGTVRENVGRPASRDGPPRVRGGSAGALKTPGINGMPCLPAAPFQTGRGCAR